MCEGGPVGIFKKKQLVSSVCLKYMGRGDMKDFLLSVSVNVSLSLYILKNTLLKLTPFYRENLVGLFESCC